MIVYDALVSEPDSKIYLDNITVLNENCSGSYTPGKCFLSGTMLLFCLYLAYEESGGVPLAK